MNAPIMKGERSKLLAVVAIMAMVVCAFAVALPATDAADDEADYSVTDTAGLLNALNQATEGQIIELATGDYGKVDVTATEGQSVANKIYFDSNGYMSILVDTPVTIRAAADATPVIYGALVVTASGVTVQGLTINITYMQNYERNAITIASESATITNNTINMVAGSTALCNGIVLYPATDGTYDISGNKFNDFVYIPGNNSNAIMVYENYALNSSAAISGFDVRYPEDLDYTSGELNMGVAQELRMVASNTFDNCQWNYTSSDYNGGSTGGDRETRVIGTEDAPAGGDVFEISGKAETGYTYTLIMQSSDKLDLELNADEKLIISSSAVYNGTVTGEGAANVTNNGLWENPSGTDMGVIEVGSSEALVSLNGVSTYKTIRLVADAKLTSGWWIGAGVTLDLNGYDLESTSIIGVNEGSYLKVPAGSELTISQIRFSTEAAPAYDWLITSSAIPATETSDAVSASMIVFTKDISATFINSDRSALSNYIPNMVTGTDIKVPGSNFIYSIRHFTAPGGDDIQYGVGINDLTYRGTAFTEGEFVFDYKSFDEVYNIIRTSSSNLVTNKVIENVGSYVDAIRLQMNFAQRDDSNANPVLVTTFLTININPADSVAEFDDNGNENIEVVQNGNAVSVSGTVSGTDGDYYVELGIDMSIFDDNGVLIPVTDGYTLTLDGETLAVTDGVITIPISSLTAPESVEIVYDADGEGTNYKPTTYTVSFSDLDADLSADIGVIDQTQYDDWNLKATVEQELGAFYDAANAGVVFGEPELQDDGTYLIKVSGKLSYMTEFPWFVGKNKMDSNGWYLPFYIDLPEGFDWSDATLKITNNTGSGDEKVFPPIPEAADDPTGDIYPQFSKIGYTAGQIKIVIDFTNENFNDLTYNLDLTGLEYEVYTGYEAEVAEDAALGNGKPWVLGGITKDDVIPETMYFISNPINYPVNTETVKYGLWSGILDKTALNVDAAIWTESFVDSGSDEIWYFSFLQQATVEGEIYGPYTMAAYYETADGIVVLDIGYESIAGTIGAGYDLDPETVYNDMVEAGAEFPTDEYTLYIAPSTMWIVWYNAQDYAGEVTATVTGPDGYTYSESYAVWQEAGFMKWYFSDDETSGHAPKFVPGIYTMKVTTTVGDVPVTLAEATVVIPGTGSYGYDDDAKTVYDDMAAAGVVWDEQDYTKVVAPETGWLVWYGEDYTGTVTGTLYWSAQKDGEPIVIYTEVPAKGVWDVAGIHKWYFSFDEGQPAAIEMAKVEGYTPGDYGYYTMVIDVDGTVVAKGDFALYDETKYYVTINDDGDLYDYEITFSSGEKFYLPGTNVDGKVVKYWELVVDGEVVNTFEEGGLVVFGQIVDKDGNLVTSDFLEFRAFVVDESTGGTTPGTEDLYTVVVNGTYYSVAEGAEILLVAPVQPGYELDGWKLNGVDFDGDSYTVNKADAVNGYIVLTPVYKAIGGSTGEVDQRTDYNVSASYDPSTGMLTLGVGSEQTGPEYINLVGGAFYYTVMVNVNGTVYYLDNVVASKIVAGHPGYQDEQVIDLDTIMADLGVQDLGGALVSVQFCYDYGLSTYGTTTAIVFIQDVVETSGYVADADAAEQAIEDALGSLGRTENIPTDIAPETVFAVFEADAGDYTLEMRNAEGEAVYQEKATFSEGGAHVWYFSLAEGQPSYTESATVTVPLDVETVLTGTYELYLNETGIGTIVI